jgi:hypothetical protein
MTTNAAGADKVEDASPRVRAGQIQERRAISAA